jgi:tetratricopeptide (TPR) repeat protein
MLRILLISLIILFNAKFSSANNQDFLKHFRLGKNLCTQGDYLLGILEYLKALELSPDSAEVHNNLAVAYLNNSFFNNNIDELKEGYPYLSEIEEVKIFIDTLTIISRERKIEAKNCLPCFADFNSVIKDAISHLEKAKNLNPNLHQAYYNLGIIYQKKEDYKNSLENFLKVLEKYENDPYFNYFVAVDYAALEDKTNLIYFLNKAINLGFNNKIMIKNEKNFKPFINDKNFKKIMSILDDKIF